MESKNAEILCIGTELLMGDIVNTNAAYIAARLAELGIGVYRQTVVGDNPRRLQDALSAAFSRADIVITTGGLGPTCDDLSKETIADYFGKKLVLHKPSLQWIEGYFQRLGREMAENNRKQAMMPEGCEVFPNPNGTAPGCAVTGNGKTAILLPGPPREMKPMFDHSAVPVLERLSGRTLISKRLYFFGIGESDLEERLRDLMNESANPTVAPYAKTGEVMLRVTASVQKGEDPEPLFQPVLERIREAAGEFLYGIDVGNLETAAVRTLTEQGLRAAAAESCTGGMVAERLTTVPGSSKVFEYGCACYSSRVKRELLGVSGETLERFGAVSEQTAREMAQRVRMVSGADIGVSVTGNAGPDRSEGKPVGLVYVGVDSEWYQEVLELHLPRKDEDAREYIRYVSSSHALNLIRKAAEKARTDG